MTLGNPRLQIFLAVLTLGFLAGPHVIKALERFQPEATPPVAEAPTTKGAVTKQPEVKLKNPFGEVSLKAKSVYVWDIKTHRRLYASNGEARLPLASVTKIMTALVASELLPADAKVTVTSADVLGEGDTGLIVGEVWSFEKLLQLTLVTSSNDGASALAGAAGARLSTATTTTWTLAKELFVEKMNERARVLGLTQTSFQDEAGLDVSLGVSGAYGSARDMAMLFEYVFRKHPKIFTPTTYATLDLRSENNIVHHVANTNQEVGHIAGIIGSKTGFTDLAGGNLVVVVDIGIDHPVVIAVLGSTREDRFSDVRQLIAATTELITQKP